MPGMTKDEAIAMVVEFGEATKRPDETEREWRFASTPLSDLPPLCRKSLLVHGHREGLVRFKKLFACKAANYAVLQPPSEVLAIVDKVTARLQAAYDDDLKTAAAELVKKRELLCSKAGLDTEDEAILEQALVNMKVIFTEESQAAVLYTDFMLPRRIITV